MFRRLLPLLFLAGAAYSQELISQMPAATLPLSGSELLTLVQGGFTVGNCPNVGQTGLCNVQVPWGSAIGTLYSPVLVTPNLGTPTFIDLTNAINVPLTGLGPQQPFCVLSNNTSSSAVPLCNTSLSILSILAPTGGTIDYSGTGTIDANLIFGATVPSSAGIIGTNSSSQLIAATSITGTPISGSTGSFTTLTTAGVVNANVASTSNINLLTGAGSGNLHLNDGTGTGVSNLGNTASNTNIFGGTVFLNNAASNAVSVLAGASSGVLHLDDGSGSGAIHIGDGTGTSAITIGNTSGPTTTAMNGVLTQTGTVNETGQFNVNVADTHNVAILTGASSGVVHINDGSGSGAIHMGDGTGSGNITIGNANNTLTINSVSTAITGVTSGSAPTAGNIGEVYLVVCPVSAGTNSVTVTSVSNAAPAVVTWSAALPGAAVGAANWTCPVYINSATTLPTGLSATTQYWLVGSSVSGNTFTLASSDTNALAGTTVGGGGSAGSVVVMSFGFIAQSTNTAYAGAEMSATAGDWFCGGTGGMYNSSTSTGTTAYTAGIAQGIATRPTAGTGWLGYSTVSFASITLPAGVEDAAISPVRENLSGTTTLYVVDYVTTGTPTNFYMGGGMTCQRYH